MFAAVAAVMALPSPSKLTTRIAGDGGDALFIVWTMKSVNHGMVHGWSTMWDLPIFAGTRGTLGYSDSLLPVAPIFGVLEQVTGSTALAVNLIALAAWTATLWWTFRLALRLVGSAPAAVFAAIAFTFSTQHLGQYRHLQLVIGGVVAGVVLLAIRFAEQPSVRRGVGLAFALTALALTASYVGLLAAIAVGVMIPIHVAMNRKTTPWSDLLRGAAVAAVVGVVLIAPFAVRYSRVTSDPLLRRQPDHHFDLSPSDLLAVDGGNRHVTAWWPVRGQSDGKTSENLLFPGYTSSVLAVAGALPILRRRDARPLLAASAILAILALGDVAYLHGHAIELPFAHLRGLPGFAGIRAPTRLLLLPMLVVAITAASGLHRLTRSLPRRAAIAVSALAIAATLFECSTRIETTPVTPTRAAAAVNVALASRPAGVVVELPMRTSVDGPAWPYVEVSRQLTATIDWHPRLNGHSGYEPPGWPTLAATVNTFPAPSALSALDARQVRYVILRTALPIDLGGRTSAYAKPGVGVLTEADAEHIIARVPRRRVYSVEHLGDAFLIELRAPANTVDP